HHDPDLQSTESQKLVCIFMIMTLDGRFRGEDIDHAKHTDQAADRPHHMERCPECDIDAIEFMPVVVQGSGTQCAQSAETDHTETQGRMEEAKDSHSRVIIDARRPPVVAY